MKAISLKQPWANWIREKKKTIETRMWKTNYRGPLLIVSSKRPNIHPAGYALAIVNLVDCRLMTVGDEDKAMCPYEPGRYAWILSNIKPIRLFPVKGMLGIYEVNFDQIGKGGVINNAVPE